MRIQRKCSHRTVVPLEVEHKDLVVEPTERVAELEEEIRTMLVRPDWAARPSTVDSEVRHMVAPAAEHRMVAVAEHRMVAVAERRRVMPEVEAIHIPHSLLLQEADSEEAQRRVAVEGCHKQRLLRWRNYPA
jgi:hypothetical protein